MSEESLGTCPDCGQKYRDPMTVLPTPSETVEVETVPWPEWAAEVHRDNECPVQRERDYVASLEAALRYFGVADLLVKVSEFMRKDEHDSEYIWGDAERWFKKEQARQDAALLDAAQPLLGKVGQKGESVFTCPSDGTWLGELIADGVVVVRCNACQTLYKLTKGKIDE
jgi:hypothetical protein